MYVRVTVIPSAKKEKFSVKTPDTIEVAVREPALRNLANSRVQEMLATHFKLAPGQIRLITGHRSRKKTFSIG